MTLNYNKEVSTSKPWTFFTLLFNWKASIWKAIYLQVIIYVILYAIISVIYRVALSPEQQLSFERVVRYFDARLSYIPLEFMFGFFCSQVWGRWTKMYDTIGFVDNIGLMTALYVRGTSERARTYRRNILRYCELIQVLVFRDVSMRARRRFPTLDTVVAAGFMLPHEKEIFENYNDNGRTPKYWIPANWAISMTYQAWKHGHIESDYYKVTLQEEIKKWRTNLEWVCNYDWVPLPLIYPQVVCLTVYLYFLVTIIARQYIVDEHEEKNEIDTYFPVMTVIQFSFYIGWMKVIEVLLNPFGEDDDDFETNALIDRNITMGLMMVDQGYNNPPEVRKDPFWNDEDVHPLYSEESSKIRNHPQRGSVSHVKLPNRVREVTMVPHVPEHDDHEHLVPHSSRLQSRRNTVRIKDEERYVPSPPIRKTTFADSIRGFIEKCLSFFRSLYARPKKAETVCPSRPSHASNTVLPPNPFVLTPEELQNKAQGLFTEKEVI